jgi:hypothetical protein
MSVNSWDTLANGARHLPCPRCLPDVRIDKTPCPRDLNGVMRIVGQVVSTGKFLYSCHSCWHQEEH